MTGQGGIAVLVSTVQVLSAVVAARSGSADGGGGGGPGEGGGGGGLRWPTAGFVAAGAVFQLCASSPLIVPRVARRKEGR